MSDIPVLTYRQQPRHPAEGYHHSAVYNRTSCFPWYRELSVYPNQELAWAEAVTWARDYEARDRYGNMAHALGVIATQGGWRGVVNYYHSNT